MLSVTILYLFAFVLGVIAGVYVAINIICNRQHVGSICVDDNNPDYMKVMFVRGKGDVIHRPDSFIVLRTVSSFRSQK